MLVWLLNKWSIETPEVTFSPAANVNSQVMVSVRALSRLTGKIEAY